MAKRRSTRLRIAIAAAILGLAAPLAAAAPATAAASCWHAGTDGRYASAQCSGYGYVRVMVRCNAIWPFSGWTDTGPRVYVNGGASVINTHAHCAAPLSVWVQYG